MILRQLRSQHLAYTHFKMILSYLIKKLDVILEHEHMDDVVYYIYYFTLNILNTWANLRKNCGF